MEDLNSHIKVLVVEDNEDSRDALIHLLIKNGFENENIYDTGFATQAIDIIENEHPDVVLLDLRIPFKNMNEIADIKNAYLILDKIKINNLQYGFNTKVIMISGSIKDREAQPLMKNDLVIDFLDKGEYSGNSKEYDIKLIKQIGQAYKKIEKEPSKVDLMIIRQEELKKLKKVDESLWAKIKKEILDEFVGLGNKKVNAHTKAKQIMVACGEVVEDIITLFERELPEISKMRYNDNLITIRNKLNYLSGRKYEKDRRSYEPVGNAYISRSSCEYAYQAYRLRSETAHGKEDDEKNDKLFPGHQYNKDDAAISISLIIPLVKEYMEMKLNKQ